ncbi:MAG: hypothetical protein NWE93_00220 [Candidatus Bathyarchaeota archaeon]|nr:hypothetical protein [Candidatus Bathyarchaeota archaeon]
MNELLIQSLGITTAALSLTLAYLFIKVYRSKHSIILIGLPLGFFFLSVSYLLLAVHLLYTVSIISSFSSFLMWLRVVSQTIGFTLIAVSYFLSGKSKGTVKKYNLFTIPLWSMIGVILILAALAFIDPQGLYSVYSLNQLFTITNLALLSYILFFTVRNMEMYPTNVACLISAPVAFAFVWLGQFSFLIWKIDGGQASLIGSQIATLVGLALFIRVYYLTSKRCAQPFDD